jgi:hypothetical protein
MSILYYSEKCSHCATLLKLPDVSNMKKINVEHDQFPAHIISVPTIVDTDNNIHVGKNAFSFIKSNQEQVQPYGLNMRNKTNNGFSYIDSTEQLYCENTNYIEL